MNREQHRKICFESKYVYHVFQELLPQYPPKVVKGQRLHLILTKALQKSRHHLAANRDEPWIYFSQKEVMALGGEDYKENFKILMELGLLKQVVKFNYVNKKQTLKAFQPFTILPIKYSERISHIRIDRSLEDFYKHKQKGLAGVVKRYLVPNLRKIKFEIEEESFMAIVEGNYEKYKESCSREFSGKRKKTPLPFNAYMDNGRYLFMKMTEFNNAYGDGILDFVTQDTFSGRIHTPITILPKYLKELDIIRFNGESMIELDIKTFQPMLLAIILRECLGDCDYSRWYFSVSDCYIALKDMFHLYDRDEAKNYMYTFVFGTTYGKKHQKFCKYFPEAGKILTKWKSTFNPSNPNSFKVSKKGSRKCNYHSNVSMMAQRKEVEYMRMLWALLGRYNIPFVTIHDAVLVPESKADIAEALIKEQLIKWFKGNAFLRRTDFSRKAVA